MSFIKICEKRIKFFTQLLTASQNTSNQVLFFRRPNIFLSVGFSAKQRTEMRLARQKKISLNSTFANCWLKNSHATPPKLLVIEIF